LRRIFRNPGIFYFDDRILKELVLSCLLNVDYLRDKCLSLIPDIGKTAQIYSILKRHKENVHFLQFLAIFSNFSNRHVYLMEIFPPNNRLISRAFALDKPEILAIIGESLLS